MNDVPYCELRKSLLLLLIPGAVACGLWFQRVPPDHAIDPEASVSKNCVCKMVFWGLREDGGGGTQGGGGFAVSGKLWLAERPPFSNMSRRGRGGEAEEEQQCSGLSRRSFSSAWKCSSVSSTSYWRSQSWQYPWYWTVSLKRTRSLSRALGHLFFSWRRRGMGLGSVGTRPASGAPPSLEMKHGIEENKSLLGNTLPFLIRDPVALETFPDNTNVG
ncbi:hypothetical protein EYF80_030662 [Liparis tanakae]|uniref:Uncharacterized protein n=1 Tax=Liparis tanakae TaxID=230148 RepID=A0A4Z2GZU5_9TELE|nr:hypothetical protein EYF80_030662 [Liparis tanakae]